MFQSIVQDELGVSLTRTLSKKDKLINPSNSPATEIFNHYRAYLIFPKTYFQDIYFNQEVRIDKCLIDDLVRTKDQLDIDYKLFDKWLVAETRSQQVFLVCKNNTLLKISKITLTNGKSIDFAGYSFQK